MREVVVGKIDCWDRRGGFAFARTADGTRFYIGPAELAKAGIQHLDIGDRVRFQTRLPTARGRAPWGTNIEVPAMTKLPSQDPLAALRQINQTPPPKRAADLVPYDYYFSHPEFKVRRPTRRRLRRIAIRGG